MSVRRREVLVLGVSSVAFGVAGCSPGVFARNRRKRKVRQYLSGLDAVVSAQVDVRAEFLASDRWMVDVVLKDNPSAESVATVVRDAYTKVRNLARVDEVNMHVSWDQGETSVFCNLPMKDADKAASATVETVSPGMERVQVAEKRISFGYRTAETLPDHFILSPTSPALSLDSFEIEQSILIGRSYCFVSHAKGKDVTSVPIKRALEAIPSDKRYGAVVSLEAEDEDRHQTRLTVRGLGQYGQDVDVQSAAAVLATVLGNQVLQRVELSTAVEDSNQPTTVVFDMKSGAVVGQGDPPEQGAPILAAAQQAAASPS